MTCREKLKKEHPNDSARLERRTYYDICPHEFFGNTQRLCKIRDKCPNPVMYSECWDQEFNAVNEAIHKALENHVHEKIPDTIQNMIDKGEIKDSISHEDTLPLSPEDKIKLEEIIASTIKDSGDRTQFSTGAVRDMHEGKGRCDLMPLDMVARILANHILVSIAAFQKSGQVDYLYDTLKYGAMFGKPEDMFLEVAKHFEDGAKKYGESNWQKGIPVNCYIDSAVRHYLKFLRGDTDERHDRAFVWNILCCIWTVENMPELNNYKKDVN